MEEDLGSGDRGAPTLPAGVHVRWVRILALTVAFFLTCTIVGAVVIGFRAAESFEAIRAGWEAYTDNVESRGSYLNQIRAAFGLGGFARRYELYQRGRDPRVLDAFERDYASVQAAVLGYESLDLSEPEGAAVASLRTILDAYAQGLERAATGQAQGDASLFPVAASEEEAAGRALNVLEREWQRQGVAAGDRLDATVSLGLNVVKRGALILPVLIAAGVLLLWLLRRLVQETAIRTRAEDIVRQSEERYRDLYDNAPNAYFSVAAADGRILRSNAAFAEMLGWETEDLTGAILFGLFADAPDGLPKARQLFEQLRSGEKAEGVELQMKHRSGRVIWGALTAEPVFGADDKVEEVRSISIDITDRKRAEEEVKAVHEELVRRANYDALTGLPNRTLLLDRLSQALIRAHRGRDKVALMFIDLDAFKHVNDTYGHDAGDQLLKEAALRLRSCVREGDTVARLAGDEFVIVLSPIALAQDAARVATKVGRAFGDPFVVSGKEERVSTSVGIAIYPDDGGDLHVLLRNADSAMYAAKEQGRNRFTFYRPAAEEKPDPSRTLEDNLRYALESGELSLAYQPILDARSRRIVGAEALLRWHSPVLGEVDPLQFIPIAEEKGSIIAIGEWAMSEACREMSRWRCEPGAAPLFLSVNVSNRQVSGGHILNTVHRALTASGLSGAQLVLEVSESLMSAGGSEMLTIFKTLADRGIGLCIDDFAVGPTAVAGLRRFPIKGVKIDRRFVHGILRDPADADLVRAVIGMAHALDFTVTAEGVETKEQAEFLLENGCDRLQGNYFSEAVSSAAFGSLIAEGSWIVAVH